MIAMKRKTMVCYPIFDAPLAYVSSGVKIQSPKGS